MCEARLLRAAMANMNQYATQLALLERLPRTWPAFFARYGTFTTPQVAALPALLDGRNVLLCAPTASGKTEAALAPLIERYCQPIRQHTGLRLMYLTPTRALASDLEARLAHPLETLGLRLAIRTGDRSSRSRHTPDLLITTPESADSLLASRPKFLANLHAIVIDELHLLDNTPRGDQLRAILRRIQQIRTYATKQGHAMSEQLQIVALSATLAAPEEVATRYMVDPEVIVVPGQRTLHAEMLALSPVDADQLHLYLAKRGWRKALLFCNSRAEIETYAAALRAIDQFGEIFVHYSNIDPQMRRETERRFAAAERAICIASGTLELGIDIGSIDLVVLLGPPGSWSSFSQRIGRGGRRSAAIHVACFYRTSLEQIIFEALLKQYNHPQQIESTPSAASFRPAVLIQQMFSLIKQSPTAAIRPAALAALFEGLASHTDLEAIGGELVQRGYLKSGRPGEWRAGAQLNELIDSQASATPGPSIHSTIQGSSANTLSIRDQQTGRTIARVERPWLSSEQLVIDGRPISIEWSDGAVVLVRRQPTTSEIRPTPLYRSARQPLSYALARMLPAQIGLAAQVAALVPFGGGWLWYHFLGEVYGRALLELLRYQVIAEETEQPGICILLAEELYAPPEWQPAQVQRYLADNYRSYEPLLNLGQFNHLLPLSIRQRVVVEQFDIACFLRAVQNLIPMRVAPELGEELGWLHE